MSLLEQDITRKGWVNKIVRQIDLDVGNCKSRIYEIEAIQNSTVYMRESKSDHLPGLYYLVSWKDYLEKENIRKLYLVIQNFRKFISLFHKKHSYKLIAIPEVIDTASLIAKPIISLTIKPMKWKQGCLTKDTNKYAKNYI